VVPGLKLFAEHFHEHSDSYVIIGGTACDLAMRSAGLEFRGTRDLDIVLLAEGLNEEFFERFWAFVHDGCYRRREREDDSRCYYRFTNPGSGQHPFMLELFSRVPDVLVPIEGSHLTPLPSGGEASSLSAILLDDAYYEFLRAGKRQEEGVSHVGAECLIPLKARAWLDLTARKAAGERVDSRAIKKHRNDVFRLFSVLEARPVNKVPAPVREDLKAFAARIAGEEVGLRQLGLRGVTVETVLDEIGRIYAL